MGNYRKTGTAYAEPAQAQTAQWTVGEEFTADFDKETEQGLVNGGVIEVLDRAPQKQEEEPSGEQPAGPAESGSSRASAGGLPTDPTAPSGSGTSGGKPGKPGK